MAESSHPSDHPRLDALLRDMAPAVEPPPELRRRALAAISADASTRTRRHNPSAWRRRMPRLAGVGALAVAVIVLVLVIVPGNTSVDPAAYELRATLSAPGDPRLTARADVTKTGIGRVIEFNTTQLPILPKGEYYELWFVGARDSPGKPNRISAGTFHPDRDGRSRVTFAAAVDPAEYPVLSITAEPGDGDPSPTRPDILRSTATTARSAR